MIPDTGSNYKTRAILPNEDALLISTDGVTNRYPIDLILQALGDLGGAAADPAHQD